MECRQENPRLANEDDEKVEEKSKVKLDFETNEFSIEKAGVDRGQGAKVSSWKINDIKKQKGRERKGDHYE